MSSRGYAAGGSAGAGKRRRRSSSMFGLKAPSRRVSRQIARVSRYSPAVHPTFTETFNYLPGGGPLAANTGGVIAPYIQEIPEYANYARLYRSFRITKFEVMFLSGAQTATASGATFVPALVSRIALSTDRSSIVTAPTAELDVLNDDRVRVAQLDKMIKYTVLNPIPNLTMNAPAVGPTATAGVSLGPGNWLSFTDALQVPHNGLSWWISNPSAGAALTECYIRVTFQCADPQ